jgi:DNA polymerase-3 subunit delta'
MGQVEIKEKLIRNVKDEKIPNAICFIDKGGRGGLQLASEIGSYIVQNQNNPIIESPYIHPDLHYIYPTKIPVDKKLFEKGMTSFYINAWRDFLNSCIYGSFNDWFSFTSSDNKTGSIRVDQITAIIRNLNLKPFQSDKKVCIIWGLDYLRKEGANKLLKTIEEPPKKTFFLLIAGDEKKIISTIASRCQMINLPPLGKEEIKEGLIKLGQSDSQSADASMVSKGSLTLGISKIMNEEVITEREKLFVSCLRDCYVAAKRGDYSYLFKKSKEVGALNKSDLKNFFLFGIDFIRQSFFYSENIKELYEFKSLTNFSIENFSVYVNTKNYAKLISLFDLNLGHIDRHANPKLLATSFLLELSETLYFES